MRSYFQEELGKGRELGFASVNAGHRGRAGMLKVLFPRGELYGKREECF